MALITTGLTNGGRTAHYQIKYDDSLAAADGKDRANALIAVCDADFDLMQGWFGGISLPYSIPYEVQINPGPGSSASWGSGPPISLVPGDGQPLDIVRYLLVAEVTEMFMLEQGFGWSPLASSEGTAGEGLSHFLATQLLMSIGSALRPSSIARLWLNSPRQDFVNNVDFSDNANDPKTGCAVLFLWYLFSQLNFSVDAIVAAGNSELSGVFRNLTGDNGDPFPFFKQILDVVFPSQTTSAIPGPNLDDPYPLGLMSFWVDKSTFGRDEVQDAINTNGGLFPDAFWLVVEEFSMNSFNALGVTIPQPTGSFANIPGITISRSGTPIDFENPGNPNAPQRIRVAYDVRFTSTSLGTFPGAGASTKELDAFLSIGGVVVSGSNASTIFELVAGADPYFTNVDPSQNNVFYLSQDLRVFTAVPGQNGVPVSAGPAFGPDSTAGAFSYIQQLLTHLNSTYSDPTGTDPFQTVLPGQGGALTGDSSVTPFTFDFSDIFHPKIFSNYNFALARVRLRGTMGSPPAQNVRVFFRLWSTETADTDYQVGSTYPSTPDASGQPGSPLVGVDHHTIPFFAGGNLSGNTDYGPGGPNIRDVSLIGSDQVWAYFGCFLNLYDSGNVIDGQNVQHWLNGTHHCIVAQIAYDDAPIINANGLTTNPENSDKLAQRNLQVTLSDNPGPADTHRIPQTFDIRPSEALIDLPGTLLDYPDELMIDWGRVPAGSTAQIYWPQVDANQVLKLADRLYGSHLLSAADAHTVECNTTRGVTYIPIPPGASQNFAGLFTVDLPPSVVRGQEFNIVVRRVATRRNREQVGIAVAKLAKTHNRHIADLPPSKAVDRPPRHITEISLTTEDEALVRMERAAVIDRAAQKIVRNWRYVVGTFQIKIPVTTPEVMLFPEENTLAIMKWRLQHMPSTSRWYPVLQRYVSYLAGRVDGLGGNSGGIEPSLNGVPPKHPSNRPEKVYTGKICEVLFDCFGEFEGLVLCDCCESHSFKTRERGIAEIALRACQERLLVSIYTTGEGCRCIQKIVIRC